MADFSKYPLRPCARCSFSLVGRFRPVSPMYTLPHSHFFSSEKALFGGGTCTCMCSKNAFLVTNVIPSL